MAFQVEITDVALGEAEDYVRFIRDNRKEPLAAEKWFRGLLTAIYSLEDLPNRNPVLPEQSEFTLELRHLIYHSHRIIYHVNSDEKIVIIYRIYHGYQKPLRATDLE